MKRGIYIPVHNSPYICDVNTSENESKNSVYSLLNCDHLIYYNYQSENDYNLKLFRQQRSSLKNKIATKILPNEIKKVIFGPTILIDINKDLTLDDLQLILQLTDKTKDLGCCIS